MAIQTDLGSGSTNYGMNNASTSKLGGLDVISTGLDKIFGTDFGLGKYTDNQRDALDREYNAEQAALSRDFNAEQAALSRDFNAAEAQKERDWSERMRDTSYLSMVEQMKKSGINPILAYQQGGASAPSGASASSGSASSGGSASGRSSATSSDISGSSAKRALEVMGSLISVLAGGYTAGAKVALMQSQKSYYDRKK